jgi:hypothetical protein
MANFGAQRRLDENSAHHAESMNVLAHHAESLKSSAHGAK